MGASRTPGFIDPHCFIVFWVLIHKWSDDRPGRDSAQLQCYFLYWVHYCCCAMRPLGEVLIWDNERGSLSKMGQVERLRQNRDQGLV